MIFQKQNCPGDSQKKAFPAFQGPFSQISIKVDVSFLSMIIPIIVCNFEHIWYLSLSSQNIFHVCTYFAQNIYTCRIRRPELCTTIRYGRQKIEENLKTKDLGCFCSCWPDQGVWGHVGLQYIFKVTLHQTDWAAILCSLDVQIGDSLYEQITTVHQRDWAVISFLFVCQQIGIQSQITLQKSRLGKNAIFS